MEKAIKVLIVDDHQIMLDGLVAILQSIPRVEILGTANNGLLAVTQVENGLSPDIIIMDIDMPVMNGLDATKKIKEINPRIKIITLSMHHEKGVIQSAIDSGSDGYMLKNSNREELQDGLETIFSGKKFFSTDVTFALLSNSENISVDKLSSELNDLTERELDVLKNICEGLSNKEIADKLFISHRTVDSHRTNLMRKLDVHNVAGLIKKAIKSGLLSD